MDLVDGKYMLFASESDYIEYLSKFIRTRLCLFCIIYGNLYKRKPKRNFLIASDILCRTRNILSLLQILGIILMKRMPIHIDIIINTERTYNMTIGNQIKNLCEEKGITINALATKSKVPASTLKNIVYGNTKNPGIETITKICYALEIELCDFFENVEI